MSGSWWRGGWIQAVAMAGACLLAGGAARGEAFSGEVELMLHRALVRDAARPEEGHNLLLYVRSDQGQWGRVWGKGFTISEHPGLVTGADISDETIRLRTAMLILGDFWVKGEWPAQFEITLDRQGDGVLRGRYEGTFDGIAVRGEVTGQLHPLRRAPEGFEPPAPDERPRVLFRRSDIPRLQAKLQTPFGQAYRQRVEASNDFINLGVLYQLTGEQRYADRAREAIQAAYRGEPGGQVPVTGFGSGGFGHEIVRVALAYDLCTEAWDGEFNTWLRTQLEDFAERQQLILMTSHANFHPCSNYYGPGRGTAGLVSMIVWGRPGAAPAAPRHPVERARVATPPQGYEPPAGAPVAVFQPGRMPTRWLWTGLLPGEVSRDVFSALGGYERARPGVGASVRYVVRTDNWFDTAEVALEQVGVAPEGVDLEEVGGEGGRTVSAWFTNLRVETEQVVRLDPGRAGVRVFLSGQELDSDAYYRLRPGVHPLTVELRTDRTAGRLHVTLDAVDEDDAGGPLALYRVKRALWQQDQARWETNRVDPNLQFWLDRGWFQNYQHYRWGIGDGGFMAETGVYAQIASWYPSVYAAAYRSFHGREVSPHPDVSHLMPRQMMQTIFPTGGRGRAQKLNSVLTLNLQWMAAHWPLIPEAYQPSALWVWNYLAGVPDASRTAAVLDAQAIWGLGGLTLAQTFVHYPLDLEPVHPRQGMPRTWAAETFGFYVFRSGFEGSSEFVSQVFAKAAPVNGWNHPNAGGFTIQGLGRQWTAAPETRNGVREQYSVVLLPGDATSQGGSARVIHHEVAPDGSGTLTLDMGDVYAAPSRGLYDGIFVRRPERLQPSGIEGLRAMGFDYSPASGADALVVLVDRIEGGGERLWTWQRAGGDVEVVEGGFVIRQGEASMRATFVTPRQVDVEAPGPERIEIGEPRTGFHGDLNRVKAAGDGNFFVILTFQEGPAPQVRIEGDGLDAVVTVGGRTVRFDGRRVIFGEFGRSE